MQISNEIKVEMVRKVYFECVGNIKNKVEYNDYPLEGLKYLTEKILDRGSVRKLGGNYLSEYLLGK